MGVEYEPLEGAQAGPNLEGSCRFLFDDEAQDNAVWFAASTRDDLDTVKRVGFFKEAKRKDSTLAKLDFAAVVVIALVDADLATDDLVLGLAISCHFDALDADSWTRLDLHREVEELFFVIEFVSWDHVDVGIATVLVTCGQAQDIFFVELGAAKEFALFNGHPALDLLLFPQEFSCDVDVSVSVGFALCDPIGDVHGALVAAKVNLWIAELYGDVAVVEIVRLEEEEVAFDQGLLVGAATCDPTDEIVLGGLQVTSERTTRDLFISDKVDLSDVDFGVLVDPEGHDNRGFFKLGDLRADGR